MVSLRASLLEKCIAEIAIVAGDEAARKLSLLL
jgi:hypothetical protein